MSWRAIWVSELTADIGHDIVADDKRRWDEEPHVPLEDVVNNKVAAVSRSTALLPPVTVPGHNGQQQCNVDPTEQSKLLSQVLLVQVADEADET